jgi:hypothetical protein
MNKNCRILCEPLDLHDQPKKEIYLTRLLPAVVAAKAYVRTQG